jgi:pimeloyl-ACP methyl ester carboxylesterase
MESIFNGFKRVDFDFKGREAIIVFPNTKEYKKDFMLKTEYFGAFFDKIETAMLEEGYILTYVKNVSRWGTDEDQAIKRDFVDFMHEKYGLNRKCICIGMSCGGYHAVSFASRYPSYVSALYLDAPLLSFDGWHDSFPEEERQKWRAEQMIAYSFTDKSELYVYNDCPIKRLKILTDNKIPVALVYGGSDTVVDCKKNSEPLIAYYKLHDAPIRFWCKPECDHHPHGLDDNKEVIDFIENHTI